MTLGRALSSIIAASAMLLGIMFFGGFGLAHAQMPDIEIPEIETPDIEVEVDVPVGGGDINCDIFQNNGQPIPQFCDDDNGGGGGGNNAQCADGIDNDGDTLIDALDPGCSGASDNDETNSGGGGGGGDGGGGTDTTQCSDGVDNDADGLIDSADPSCENAADNDESPGASGSGGGGSGGGSGSGGSSATTSGEVLAATDEPAKELSCDTYLTVFIRSGRNNDEEQVKRLQHVLIDSEKAEIEENGVYDAGTLAAVHAFQTKYASEILTPWGIKNSTGYVYLTTRKKVNELYCKMTKEFPLSSEEVQTIAESKAQESGFVAAAAAAAPAKQGSVETKTNRDAKKKEETKKQPAVAATATDESAVRSFDRVWRPISNFINRILGR